VAAPLRDCSQLGSKNGQHQSYLSFANIRLSRCGFVRDWPVESSHFSPGFAPQIGHRTVRVVCLFRFIVGL
jgi:hypothetical protein